MNERIQELVEQCRHAYSEHRIDLEKFAEMIVEECAYVIQQNVSLKFKEGGETEEFMAGHYAGSLLSRVVIKQHFGVNG